MESDKRSIVSVSLEKGYRLISQKINDKIPSYHRVAIVKGDKMDLLDLMCELKKGERDIILYIKNNISYCADTEEYVLAVNIKNMKVHYSQSQRCELSKSLKSLIDKNIIAKLKVNTYMINPDLLIPQKYDKWKAIYNKA